MSVGAWTEKASVKGTPFTVALPSRVKGPLNEPTVTDAVMSSASSRRLLTGSVKFTTPFTIESRPTDMWKPALGSPGFCNAPAPGVNSQFGTPSASASRMMVGR